MVRRLTEEAKQELKDLWRQGVSAAEISRRLQVKYSTVGAYCRAFKRGLSTINDYHNQLLQQRGFASQAAYQRHLVLDILKFATLYAYHSHLVKEKGYESWSAYTRYRESIRQEQPKYKKSGRIISQRLREIGQTQEWLAGEFGVTKQMVIRYTHGRSIPRKEARKRLCELLQIDTNTLDNIVNEKNVLNGSPF